MCQSYKGASRAELRLLSTNYGGTHTGFGGADSTLLRINTASFGTKVAKRDSTKLLG